MDGGQLPVIGKRILIQPVVIVVGVHIGKSARGTAEVRSAWAENILTDIPQFSSQAGPEFQSLDDLVFREKISEDADVVHFIRIQDGGGQRVAQYIRITLGPVLYGEGTGAVIDRYGRTGPQGIEQGAAAAAAVGIYIRQVLIIVGHLRAQADIYFFTHLVIEVESQDPSFIIRIFDDPSLRKITCAQEISEIGGASAEGQRIIGKGGRAEDRILPVSAFAETVYSSLAERQSDLGGIVLIGIGGDLVQVGRELFGIHHVEFFANMLYSRIRLETDGIPAGDTFFSRDHDHSVGAAATINGRGRCILQYFDGEYIGRIQRE